MYESTAAVPITLTNVTFSNNILDDLGKVTHTNMHILFLICFSHNIFAMYCDPRIDSYLLLPPRKSTVTPAVALMFPLPCRKSPWATPWSLETLPCKAETEYHSQVAVLSSKRLNSWMATSMLLSTMCRMLYKVDCFTPAPAIYQSTLARLAIANHKVVRSTGKRLAHLKYS